MGASRISGSFVSGGAAASRQTAAPTSTYDGITVLVKQNASIRVDVSSNGTFTLSDVPSGNVTLMFTRDGATLGEIAIRGVGTEEDIRVVLELRADDSVILVEIRRSSDGSSDDDSHDGELELELDPDKWCFDASGGHDHDGAVFATIKGDSIDKIDPDSITLTGPSATVTPTSVAVKSDRLEVVFEQSVAKQAASSAAEGQRFTIHIRGQFNDGTTWELTASVRIKCEDDDSDSNSSG